MQNYYNYLNHLNYNSDRLITLDSEQCTIPKNWWGLKVCHRIPLQYNYCDGNSDDLLIEGCEMETDGGIKSMYSSHYSILCRFDLDKNKPFIDAIHKIYRDCAKHLYGVKDEVGIPKYDLVDNDNRFPCPINSEVRPRDAHMYEQPFMSLKLIYNSQEQTIFTDSHGKFLPWHQIAHMEMTLTPLLRIKSICVTEEWAKLQIEVLSAIVILRPIINKQIPTLNMLNQSRPELSDLLKGQLATIAQQRKIPGFGPASMQDDVITYDKFNIDYIINLPPEYICVSNPFWKIPLLYKYNINDIREIYIEGPELETMYGIKCRSFDDSYRLSYYMISCIDQNNLCHMGFMNTMDQIHNKFAIILDSYKNEVGMPSFRKDEPETTGFPCPMNISPSSKSLYLNRNEIVLNPLIYLKLMRRGSGYLLEQTMFTDIKGLPIPWEILQNVRIKFIPLFHLKYIYIQDGRASFQIELESAVVTSITESCPH